MFFIDYFLYLHSDQWKVKKLIWESVQFFNEIHERNGPRFWREREVCLGLYKYICVLKHCMKMSGISFLILPNG